MIALAALLALAGSPPERIQLRVTTIAESGAGRSVLSEALIEGPPGTDFGIRFRIDRFVLDAQFRTDLSDAGGLDVVAALSTKRRYGMSPRNLPLYEEDEQRHDLRVGFDEAIVLLPFGGGGGDTLKIEIAPTVVSGGARPDKLSIQLVKPAPNGVIDISARRVPHRFVCAARLLDAGREVAAGSARCSLDRPQEVVLAAQEPVVVSFTVDGYLRDRPADAVTFHFDVDRGAAERRPLARHWAGAATIGEEIGYDLGEGRELRLTFHLAEGERP